MQRDAAQSTADVKIFVGGITSETTREDLLLFFSQVCHARVGESSRCAQFGKVTGVSVPWDHAARRNRGFAFVTFAVRLSIPPSARSRAAVPDRGRPGVRAALLYARAA